MRRPRARLESYSRHSPRRVLGGNDDDPSWSQTQYRGELDPAAARSCPPARGGAGTARRDAGLRRRQVTSRHPEESRRRSGRPPPAQADSVVRSVLRSIIVAGADARANLRLASMLSLIAIAAALLIPGLGPPGEDDSSFVFSDDAGSAQ